MWGQGNCRQVKLGTLDTWCKQILPPSYESKPIRSVLSVLSRQTVQIAKELSLDPGMHPHRSGDSPTLPHLLTCMASRASLSCCLSGRSAEWLRSSCGSERRPRVSPQSPSPVPAPTQCTQQDPQYKTTHQARHKSICPTPTDMGSLT